MCEGKPICESKEKIREWISGKYIVILHNQIRFAPERYFESSRVKESRLTYIPVSSQVSNIHPYKVQQTHLRLQDYDSMQLDDWTELEIEGLFKLNE